MLDTNVVLATLVVYKILLILIGAFCTLISAAVLWLPMNAWILAGLLWWYLSRRQTAVTPSAAPPAGGEEERAGQRHDDGQRSGCRHVRHLHLRVV